VSPIFLRDPTHIAQLAATWDELSQGRAEIVCGIGNLAMLDQYGITWQGTRPLARLREAVAVIRAVLDHGAIDVTGDFYRYSGVFTAARAVQAHNRPGATRARLASPTTCWARSGATSCSPSSTRSLQATPNAR
jgi:alkanesulfonate monooxygenase SsuD/methylene tetrahydromethanopterin reductase-like flavin-dependent oxidoreductase (luciferase family)